MANNEYVMINDDVFDKWQTRRNTKTFIMLPHGGTYIRIGRFISAMANGGGGELVVRVDSGLVNPEKLCEYLDDYVQDRAIEYDRYLHAEFYYVHIRVMSSRDKDNPILNKLERGYSCEVWGDDLNEPTVYSEDSLSELKKRYVHVRNTPPPRDSGIVRESSPEEECLDAEALAEVVARTRLFRGTQSWHPDAPFDWERNTQRVGGTPPPLYFRPGNAFWPTFGDRIGFRHRNHLPSQLQNPGIGFQARRRVRKKRSIFNICEHFFSPGNEASSPRTGFCNWLPHADFCRPDG